ncbi:hypothetical protein ETAA8_11230 [Anatilimnocola aggregata]|uniref:Uncharacterized protein n=1 Tax=Anatilimnocola aggregata TaxID=2528021 RepID=A0A517Y742_9BACT|nr:hypothetical protein [Anatilimnocola aggregata]QDU26051.1 hypothetical protein ETAA8_11230 [Anatilimnocola aggregata]
MTAVTLACPHCAGNIQVDTDYAGQQVACPLCHNALMLPPAEVLAQFLAAAPPAFQPPPQEQLFTLGCPVCNNPLQVTAALSGQQVGCPHCNTPIMVPPLTGHNPQEVAAEAVVEPAPTTATGPDIQSMLPPGTLPPSSMPPANMPPTAPVRPVPQRPEVGNRQPPTRPASPSVPPSREPPGADRLPPTRGESSSAPKSPAVDPTRSDRLPPGGDRMPPGADRLPPTSRESKPREERTPPRREPTTKPDDRLPPQRKPVGEPRAAAPSPERSRPQPVSAPPPAVDEMLPPGAMPPSKPTPLVPTETPDDIAALLPPGAAAARPAPSSTETKLSEPGSSLPSPTPSAIEHLLPPGATEVTSAAVGQPTALQPTRIVDSMLPPGATAGPVSPSAPGAEVPLPKPAGGPLRPVLAPGASVSKPGLGGLQVQGRDGKKIRDDEDVGIRKLTDAERASRRLRRNAVMFTVLLMILFAVFYFMAR